MHTNRLIQEKSPYLLQHAGNPVDWYPWGPEAFERARREDKPIFLSIGYSTCHWCHVMERESFENEQIADILNRNFVPIKVDREERPDVDRIYMQFVQASTGGGGWPMSVWLTPDLKPFFGGTYFPPDNRYGRPGFASVLEQLASAWRDQKAQIVQSSVDVVEQLEGFARVASGDARVEDASVLESGFFQFRRAFDSRLGGFGQAPKFPRPAVLNFLLRYAYHTGGREPAEMALVTLREMAKGGMHDQLGGGFHRYSVDDRWFVPHFEKMLYDQAQLAISYLEGYQVSGDESLAAAARDVFDYVLRDMTDKDGGFYSAEDADSAVDPAHPEEKREGAFYIWTAEELEIALGNPLYEWFAYRYGVDRRGNVTNDPHGEFTGGNILYERHSIAETAGHFGVPEDQVAPALAGARDKLADVRSRRIRPYRDDKILAGWNGLMISAFAFGARVLGEASYLKAADRAATFVFDRMYDRGRNVLLRRHRDGDSDIDGFLDDYAFYSHGLLDLYEASFDERWLSIAETFARRMRELFEDSGNGGFFSTVDADPTLVLRMKEDYDGAEPSGNSMATLILIRLAHITGSEEYRLSAERTLRAFGSRLRQTPTGVPQMMIALLAYLSPPRQIVLAGDPERLAPFLVALRRRFLPFHLLLRADPASVFESLRNMPEIEEKPAAYVCEDFTCRLPATEVGQLIELLQ
jgi:uncharacterized protein